MRERIKPYFLNKSTKVLHIRGCCTQSDFTNDATANGFFFRTENEVWQSEGLTFRWCQDCLKWRENAVNDALQHNDEKGGVSK